MKSPHSTVNAYGIKMPYAFFFVFLFFIGLSSMDTFSQQLAFPAAYGAASTVTGGRGGTVVHVTNLNNSGTGSLRDAVSASNRIIVFDVSGTIELTSDLSISTDNLTIAGQSAPLGGITITGKAVYFQNADNIILRYLRFRPDYNTSGIVDALNIVSCNNFVADHCSISWGGDEACSIVGTSSNVTIQNCIFGESSTGMLAGDSNSAISGNLSIIGNLWYNISHRFPNVNASRVDVINNVVHNWFTRLMVVSANDNTHLNEINNFYQSGTRTGSPRSYDYAVNWLDIGSASQRSNIRIYTNGNVYPSFLTEAGDDWSLYVNRFAVTSGAYAGTAQWSNASTNFKSSTPFTLLGATPITSAAQALINVPLNAGANKYLNSNGSAGVHHDNVDAIYITNVTNGTSESYSYPPVDIVNKQSYRDFHNSVSSTPINVRPANYDTNNDGMPDVWKLSRGFAADANLKTHVWPSGYIGIEDYLNEIEVAEGSEVTANAGQDVSICDGSDTTLSATGGSTYLWSTGATTASITVSPNSTTTYTVTAYNAAGTSDTDNVLVTVKPMPAANAGSDIATCRGTGVTLTATGGGSYLWNTGATSASITVNPNNTTTYTVQVTLNGCTSSDDVKVTVNELPSVSAGTDVAINLGESVSLSANGATSYLWNTGATTSTINVSPITTTTYSVTGTSSGCSATDSVKVTVVNTSVIANAGSDVAICVGESTTLTATGGSTYIWNNGQTTASITVSPATTSTYTVTAYDATGANSDTDDVRVTVNQLPSVDAGSDVAINLGQSVTLSATGASSYSWNTGASTPSISVSPTVTTTYTVTGTSASGCSKTDTVRVTVQTGTAVSANAGQDVSICDGNSTTLTATGGATYLWSTGATTANISVSPASTTTYSVTAYDSTGINSDMDEVVVRVNSTPTIQISPNFTINSGQYVILYAFGANSFSWSNGQTGWFALVSPTVTTTYTVVGTNSSGCEATASVTITVASGNSYTGNAGIDKTTCSGYGVTLTANGGDSYLWSTGETTRSIDVNPNSTTAYTVVAYTPTAEITDEVMVYVKPNPVVHITNGNDVTILEGEYITLSATGANRYEWNNGATLANIAVNPSTSTTYSVIGYIQDCSDSKEVTVNVVPEVTAFAGDDKTICLNEQVTLTATGGDDYLWNTGETTESIIVTPTEDTEYSVTVYNDLDYDDANVMVYVNDCSANENPENPETYEFLVYPNPTSGNLNIKISGVLEVSSISMYDLSGKILFNEMISAEDGELGFERILDLSNYSDGLYLLKLVDNQRNITKKIVLSR